MKQYDPHRKIKANLSRIYDDLNGALFLLKNGYTTEARNYINGAKGDIKTQIKNLQSQQKGNKMNSTDKQLERYQKALTQIFLKTLDSNKTWNFDLKEALNAKTFSDFKKKIMTVTEFRDIAVLLYGKELLGVLNKDCQLEKFYKENHVNVEN